MSSNTIFDGPELRRGARACLAPAAAVFIFAFVLGALAHQRGWGLSYLVLFILGISGASVQAVAIQMWSPVNDILPLFVACFSVHLRYARVHLPQWRGIESRIAARLREAMAAAGR